MCKFKIRIIEEFRSGILIRMFEVYNTKTNKIINVFNNNYEAFNYIAILNQEHEEQKNEIKELKQDIKILEKANEGLHKNNVEIHKVISNILATMFNTRVETIEKLRELEELKDLIELEEDLDEIIKKI